MCRGLGHGQPRFSSRLESLAEELKMLDGLPLELLHDCLISEKDHLHFASKNLPDCSAKKILVDWAELGPGICFYQQMPQIQPNSLPSPASLWLVKDKTCLKFKNLHLSVNHISVFWLITDDRKVFTGWFMFGVNPEKAVCVLFVSFVEWFDVQTER